METRLANIRRKEKFDVRICRGTKWGNQFVIGKDGTREQVVEKYRKWILTQPQLLNSLHELNGKILGCYCAPEKCHGDILIELINSELWQERHEDRLMEARETKQEMERDDI